MEHHVVPVTRGALTLAGAIALVAVMITVDEPSEGRTLGALERACRTVNTGVRDFVVRVAAPSASVGPRPSISNLAAICGPRRPAPSALGLPRPSRTET